MQQTVVIIGGGIYGCCIALACAAKGLKVHLHEAKSDILRGATTNNTLRIHNGMHYPLSSATRIQCYEGYTRFLNDFGDACHPVESHYYLASDSYFGDKSYLKVFEECKCRGMEGEKIAQIDSNLVTNVRIGINTKEHVLDVDLLRVIMKTKLAKAGVKVFLNSYYEEYDNKMLRTTDESPNNNYPRLSIRKSGRVHIKENPSSEDILQDDNDYKIPKIKFSGGEEYLINQTFLVNASYHRMKEIGVPISHDLDLSQTLEYCAIPIVKMPEGFHRCGITIMDGQYGTLFPYKNRKNYYTLYSVKHSRIVERSYDLYRSNNAAEIYKSINQFKFTDEQKATTFENIREDLKRFIPQVENCELQMWLHGPRFLKRDYDSRSNKSRVADAPRDHWKDDCQKNIYRVCNVHSGKLDAAPILADSVAHRISQSVNAVKVAYEMETAVNNSLPEESNVLSELGD